MSEKRTLGVVEAAYRKIVEASLRTSTNLLWLTAGETAKALTIRQKIWRIRKVVVRVPIQMLHDWAEKKGAHCHDNY